MSIYEVKGYVALSYSSSWKCFTFADSEDHI